MVSVNDGSSPSRNTWKAVGIDLEGNFQPNSATNLGDGAPTSLQGGQKEKTNMGHVV